MINKPKRCLRLPALEHSWWNVWLTSGWQYPFGLLNSTHLQVLLSYYPTHLLILFAKYNIKESSVGTRAALMNCFLKKKKKETFNLDFTTVYKMQNDLLIKRLFIFLLDGKMKKCIHSRESGKLQINNAVGCITYCQLYEQ